MDDYNWLNSFYLIFLALTKLYQHFFSFQFRHGKINSSGGGKFRKCSLVLPFETAVPHRLFKDHTFSQFSLELSGIPNQLHYIQFAGITNKDICMHWRIHHVCRVQMMNTQSLFLINRIQITNSIESTFPCVRNVM